MRIPRPPPPATALIMIEEPVPKDLKKVFASSRLVAPEVHGITAMPHRVAMARACTLSPNSSRTSARERRVLAQKAVAGMNGIAAGFLGDSDDPFGVEICFRARAFDRDGVIGFAGVQRMNVIIRINRGRAHAEFGGGAHDTDGDFTSVGDQKIARVHGYDALPLQSVIL